MSRGGDPADRWVLFDLDGTLLDYATAESAAVTATLGGAGVDVTDAVLARYREVNQAHWERLERRETTPERLRTERWAEVLAHHRLHDVDADEVAVRYVHHLAAGAHVVDGAEEVLDAVAAAGLRVGYVTNGLADVQRPRLAAGPLADRAEVVVISDEVGAAKPDRAFFDAAFAAMGHPDRDSVTVVGDSLSADVAGAANYGLRSIWYAPAAVPEPGPDAPRPTHRVTRLRDVIPLLVGDGARRPA